MHSAQASRAQRPVRKQTRDQKQQCVDSQQIICQRVGRSKRDNDADQSNNGQATPTIADETVKMWMQMSCSRWLFASRCGCVSPFMRSLLSLVAKATVQRIAWLIEELKGALTKTAFEIH
jgi:hypothetical protein